MREIVDKHFPDNWVLSLYMGSTVNLCEAWEPYRAAQAALNNTLQLGNIAQQAARHVAKVPQLNTQIAHYLKEGVLVEETVLDHVQKLVRVRARVRIELCTMSVWVCGQRSRGQLQLQLKLQLQLQCQ